VLGSEISARWDGISVHLLSYLHDPAHPALLAETERTRAARLVRARTMVELLGEDYGLTWDDVMAHTGADATVGRPHIADALVARGVVADRSAAFATMLVPSSRYYVPHYAPDAVDAVVAIRASGGVPVFAHPGADARGRVVPDGAVEQLADAGLAGLEVHHRDHGRSQRTRLAALADRLGLLVTGSSDYHGAGKPNLLGENTTAADVLDRIEEQGTTAVVRP
jgi:predicted metal-dependent phosphoesterase TrpH